ncbi:hypothetical protein NEPTK9_001004 [Candidatus Neptunochlamydia vexilliferae]|uniref:Uncharacterized protein n=1 Tax=Candidatus Neptunichlamydia vexilliferae TaxID=1651774 RepID=A0ABS0AZV8_9BACT|nr:hypothetical protein [Candidatus Neptunochlamydia vexilliferae]
MGGCQSQRSRFSPIKAVPYPGDRGDAEGVKAGDAGSGKTQILSRNGYNTASMYEKIIHTAGLFGKKDLS